MFLIFLQVMMRSGDATLQDAACLVYNSVFQQLSTSTPIKHVLPLRRSKPLMTWLCSSGYCVVYSHPYWFRRPTRNGPCTIASGNHVYQLTS